MPTNRRAESHSKKRTPAPLAARRSTRGAGLRKRTLAGYLLLDGLRDAAECGERAGRACVPHRTPARAGGNARPLSSLSQTRHAPDTAGRRADS
ncbi:hypothetical protein AAFF_G00158350 [Aldrovandia affinis]|uniref:Uncharacterized protein n=1 Tax=Aldrovandia affinis TaxID=143900 RepID=A0AAD7RNA3_9TELE|nr:hypothetical protein AAFF_G00158350 [Aldrovandia affinis]